MTSTALVVGLSHLASWAQTALLHGDHSSREVRIIVGTLTILVMVSLQLRLVKRSEAGLYTGTLAQLRHLLHHPAPLGSRAPARAIFSAVLDTDDSDNSDNSDDNNSDDQPGQTLTVYKQSLLEDASKKRALLHAAR